MVSNICRYSIVSYTLHRCRAKQIPARRPARMGKGSWPESLQRARRWYPSFALSEETCRRRAGRKATRGNLSRCRHHDLKLAFRVFPLLSFRLRGDLVPPPRPGELRGRCNRDPDIPLVALSLRLNFFPRWIRHNAWPSLAIFDWKNWLFGTCLTDLTTSLGKRQRGNLEGSFHPINTITDRKKEKNIFLKTTFIYYTSVCSLLEYLDVTL